MRQLLDTVKRVAKSNAAILISGESGSGKEIIARAIHHYSARSSGPWVDINCGALPESLAEDELFGHEQGAFTGAAERRPGLFELASGGTIFLDEVGELAPQLQVKLLRILDGNSFYRLGAKKKIQVDVRVIAATNRDLKDAVRSHSLRADLFHRLNQIAFHVPPLRERPEDLEVLARFFAAKASPEVSLEEDAISRLKRWPWPGNVRELRNVVTRAVLLCRGDSVSAAELELDSICDTAARESGGVATASTLATLEEKAILDALDETAGVQKEAARLLGISPRTLSRRLRTYEKRATSQG